MVTRIQQLLEAEGLSPQQFAERIGVQRSAISHIMSGRNKPSFDMMRRIIEAFPHVSAEWLIVGRGRMRSGPAVPLPSLFEAVDEGRGAEEGPNCEFTNVNNSPPSASPADVGQLDAHKPRGGDACRGLVRVLLLYSDGTFDSYGPSI